MKRNHLAIAITAGLLASIPPEQRVFAEPADGSLPVIRPRMELRPLAAAGEYELMIYGDIGECWWGESVTAASIVTQLAALDANTTQINVRINSYGGSVSDALAIYNVLKRTSAKKMGTVDGVAMSSASLIAMACDELSMPATSLLMIHAPWGIAQGNANDMRIMADVLDTYSQAMVSAYVAKSGMASADVLQLLQDGQDHYYTGEQAVAAGFADELIEAAPATEPEEAAGATAQQAAQSRPRGLDRFLSRAPTQIAAMAIVAARRLPVHAAAAAASPASTPPAARVPTTHEDNVMPNPVAANPANPAAAAPTPAQAPASQPNENDIRASAQTAMRDRNTAIQASLNPVMAIGGVRELYERALLDPSMTIEQVNAQALVLAGAGASPSGGGGIRVAGGADQIDRDREAMTNWIMARADARGPDGQRALANAAPDNPFRGFSLYAMAEHFVRAAGVNTARMTRTEVVAAAMSRPQAAAGLTTSDFPNLLENTLNKLLVAAYTGAATTWQRFCRVTDLVDFRANPRYRIGTFSDLKVVNESGNYEQGSVSDAERESITAVRKGRLLVITREMIVNDDLQAFADIARGLGAIANRTIDKDVFALFALNTNTGPTMGDGNPLFHASHSNIAGTAAAPTVAAFEAARVQMAQQQDPSGNDYLDIRPAIWLGPVGIGGSARVVNGSLYDPDATNKLQRPNIVNGLFDDIVDTPRLSSTPWYALASPDMEPVFEVGFVGGQRTPIVEQDRDFTSDGLRWKVVLEYGVAATGWRGIVKNAGA